MSPASASRRNNLPGKQKTLLARNLATRGLLVRDRGSSPGSAHPSVLIGMSLLAHDGSVLDQCWMSREAAMAGV